MSDVQTCAFVIAVGVAIACWADAVLARRKCDDLEKQNREMRRRIDQCINDCTVGRRQREKREEAWKWN